MLSVRVPDQLGAGSGRDTVRANVLVQAQNEAPATVLRAVDFQKVVAIPVAKPVAIPIVVKPFAIDGERAHVKREWHSLLDAAVLVVGVNLAGAEVVGVHAPVAFDRARSGDDLEAGGLSMRCCSGLEERAQDHDLEARVERHDVYARGTAAYRGRREGRVAGTSVKRPRAVADGEAEDMRGATKASGRSSAPKAARLLLGWGGRCIYRAVLEEAGGWRHEACRRWYVHVRCCRGSTCGVYRRVFAFKEACTP
eukprot:scaffold109355_cov75-Phaeocystis_antarctica.AAC.2